jgi:small-conductance mechanosensitive channel
MVLGSIAEAAITLLIGWYAWRLFETILGVKLSREERGAQSRARTVQPLLRAVGKLVIGAIALMSALSSLGLNILPLLASAGVVGIAVGFGAQTLVRDLFSGASYLIEDLFCVGDYIESGNAKGIVERISFRAVALRHQNGPLHFVPYGSLSAVRNDSRDWVVDKFEIPLPVTVDSERVRKLVKKIGLEMVADPELAKVIDVPLKAKLYRIDPGVKIFRCKVQTPPGKQFEIRAGGSRRRLKNTGSRLPTTPLASLCTLLRLANRSSPPLHAWSSIWRPNQRPERSAIRRVWGAAALPPRSPSMQDGIVGTCLINGFEANTRTSAVGQWRRSHSRARASALPQ